MSILTELRQVPVDRDEWPTSLTFREALIRREEERASLSVIVYAFSACLLVVGMVIGLVLKGLVG